MVPCCFARTKKRKTIPLIGGEPEEEVSLWRTTRQAVRNGGAKLTSFTPPIRLTAQASQFIHAELNSL